MEQDTVVMQDIYQYVQEGIDENGRRERTFRSDRHSPQRSWTSSNRAGVRLPAERLPPTRDDARLDRNRVVQHLPPVGNAAERIVAE